MYILRLRINDSISVNSGHGPVAVTAFYSISSSFVLVSTLIEHKKFLLVEFNFFSKIIEDL